MCFVLSCEEDIVGIEVGVDVERIGPVRSRLDHPDSGLKHQGGNDLS